MTAIRPTMYEFAGGEEAFLALAAAHHQRCLDDPVLNHPFSHPGHPQHVERLAAYWAEVFGGPTTYSDSCGGHSAMLVIHTGHEMQDDLGDRFVACFVGAADDAGLPGDPEFRDALRRYMEWAVREVLSSSPRGSQVEHGPSTPRWAGTGSSSRPALAYAAIRRSARISRSTDARSPCRAISAASASASAG